MDWRERYADRHISLEDAAARVSSGERVWFGMFTSNPESICRAVYERRSELRNLEVHHYVSPFPWVKPETEGIFDVVTAFTTPADRQQVREGLADYLPMGNFRQSHVKEIFGDRGFDMCFVKTSPPDENGFMSLGTALWANRTIFEISKRVICEVDERLIRTHGENWIHINDVEALVEHDQADDLAPAIPPRSQEVIDATEVVGTLLASELIRDGDTLQIGIGDVTSALALYLGEKRDLGIQTELIPGGIVDLVERGVITGRQKQVAPGKVVGSAFAVLPPEEALRVHMNPTYELWDFCNTDDLRTLVREDNFVAINNALQVDLTGQVTAETLGGQVFSGPGGQTVFAVAASYSEGGRSVIGLPSSSVVDGVRHSRIVSTLEAGTMVTVPRTFVDYVVTEQGIATLHGKTVRQRIEELISVAHPDCRAELRGEASTRYHVQA